MAKIIEKTRSKGTIQTSEQGNIKYHFKKPFRGAFNYELIIEGRNTGIKDLDLDSLMQKLKMYVARW